MSQQALADFLTRISSDEALFAAFGAATGDRRGHAAYAAVADFASGHGFDVSPADAETFYASLTAGEGELSDEALDDISGGTSGNVMTLMTSMIATAQAGHTTLIATLSNTPAQPIARKG